MNYHNDLTYQLRRRGCTEDKVTEILHTVDDAVSSTGQSPEAELGIPETYAAQFDGPRKTTRGRKVLSVCGLLGLVCVAIYAIWPQLFNFTNPIMEQFAGMIALLILVMVGVTIGSVIDYRLPAAYTEQRESAQDHS